MYLGKSRVPKKARLNFYERHRAKDDPLRLIFGNGKSFQIFFFGKYFHSKTKRYKGLLKLIGPIFYIAHYLNINMVHIITRKVRPSERPKVVKLLLLISKNPDRTRTGSN